MFAKRSISRIFPIAFILILILTQAIPARADGSWTSVNPMGITRAQHTATLLSDGKVLIAGGYDQPGSPSSIVFRASTEIFDPATNAWSSMASMTIARSGHTATLLPGGKVLITGGYNGGYLASAELYDPTSNTWSSAGSMVAARVNHTSTLLPN